MSNENICYRLIEKNESNEILDIQKISKIRTESIGSDCSFDFFHTTTQNETNISMKKLLLIFEYYNLSRNFADNGIMISLISKYVYNYIVSLTKC